MAQLAIAAAVMAVSYAIDYFSATHPKVDPIDKGRNNDVRVQGSDYGQCIPIILGRARIAPQIVWNSPIREVVTTTPGRGGGKGAPHPPSPATNNYQYFTSLLLEVCAGPLAVGIRKIWANADIVYNLDGAEGVVGNHEAEAADNTRAGGAALVADANCSGGRAVSLPTTGAQLTFNRVEGYGPATSFGFAYVTSATGAVDVYLNGVFNRTVTLTATAGALAWYTTDTLDIPVGSSATVRLQNATTATKIDQILVQPETITEPPDPAITGIFDHTLAYALNLNDNRTYYNQVPTTNVYGTTVATAVHLNARIRTYNGAADQEVDGLLQTRLGPSAQAYRNRALVMLEELELPGGQVQQFTVEVDEGTATVDQALIKLLALVDVPGSKLDVSALAGTAFRGLVINQRGEVRPAIEALQIAYNFDFVEVDGLLKAVVRGTPTPVVIPQADLRASDYGQAGAAGPVQVTRLEGKSLPRTVAVQYLDPKLDYKNNAQQDSRHSGRTEDNETVVLPLVLLAEEAQAIATRLLYVRHLERTQFEWTTTWKYLALAPTDLAKLVLNNGTTHTVRITEMQAGLVGQIHFKGVKHAASVYTTRDVFVRSGAERPVIEPPANSYLGFFDVPALRPEDDELGRYIGAVGRGLGAWRGAGVFEQQSAGEYQRSTDLPVAATMGLASSSLACNATPEAWDDAGQLAVNLWNGELSSLPDKATALASADNILIYGNEILQFLTATPQSAPAGYASRYLLTGLRRGLGGTDYLLGRPQKETARWQNKANVTESVIFATLTKTATANTWDAGASSAQSFATTEQGTVEYVPQTGAHDHLLGVSPLSATDTAGPAEIAYGWIINGTTGLAYPREADGTLLTGQSLTAGTTRLGLAFGSDGRVAFMKDGAVIAYSANVPRPAEFWRADVSAYTVGATIRPPTLSFPFAAETRARRQVTFAAFNLSQPQAAGGLAEVGSSTNFGAHATTAERLRAGQDGSYEVTLTSASNGVLLGLLPSGNTYVDHTSCPFGVYFSLSGGFVVPMIAGNAQATILAPAAGARVRLSVEAGGTLCRLYYNDSLLYQFAASPAPSGELRAAVGFNAAGAAVGQTTFLAEAHYLGEPVALANSALKFRTDDTSALFVEKNYKAVTTGQDVGVAAVQRERLLGNSVRPLQVARLRGQRNALGDLLLEWDRRARRYARFRDNAPALWNEQYERYAVEILSAGGEVLQTYRYNPRDPQPAVLYNTSGTGISGNNLINPTGGTYTAATRQQFTAAGDVLEATFTADDHSGASWPADGNTRGGAIRLYLPSNLPVNPASATNALAEWGVTVTFNAPLAQAQVQVSERGTAVTGIIVLGGATANTLRLRIELSDGGVRFSRVDNGTSVPFYTSARAFTPNYVGFGNASQYSSVRDIIISRTQNPQFVYTAAMQTANFGSVQAAVRARVFQESPIVGRGFEAEQTL